MANRQSFGVRSMDRSSKVALYPCNLLSDGDNIR